jgi:membrane-associated protease RseP (regulator of RpoE activity)
MHDDYTASLRLTANRIERTIGEFLAVYDVTLGVEGQPQAIRLRGHLQVPADKAYPEISARLREMGYTAILRRDDEVGLDELVATPGTQPEAERPRLWVHGLLLGATVLTTLYVGAGMSEARPPDDLWWPLFNFWQGWPFALSLLSILLAHEMGHYVASLRNGVAATLPYFIPLPIPDFFGNVLGTLGAVIRMKGQIPNRRVMLDIGAAGPLTGLIVTIPVLVLGLSMSHIQPLPVNQAYQMEGNSLLYLLIKYALFGRWLPSNGVDVFIHPVAFAGWAGLLVTSLNLIPAGQLDGGHVLYSLVGDRAQTLRWPIVLSLAALGLLVWPGWFLWAGLVFFLGQGHPPPLDSVTRLGTGRKILAVLVLVVFILTFSPQPLIFVFPEGVDPAASQSALGLGAALAGMGVLARRRRKD